MARDQSDLLQGTLELLILKTLSLEPMHGWGITQRIGQMSSDVFQVNQGSLYPGASADEEQGADPVGVAGDGEQSPGPLLRADRGGRP
jgi:PadR family transcriptional regulator, regulatory protein PadR